MNKLQEHERALLVSFIHSDTLKVLLRIMEDAVAEFDAALKATQPVDKEAVLAAHSAYMSAAAFYASVIDRLNHEVNIYTSGKAPQVLPDPTENLFELS